MDLNKKILSEIALFHGHFSMPKGYEDWFINRDILATDIFISQSQNTKLPSSRVWDMLDAYIREHINCYYHLNLINKETWGNIYKPNEISKPLLNVDPIDLKNSPDYTCLYGVKVDECMVKIHYEDNRRKGRSWDISLENNKFIIFPSSCMYYLTNHQKDNLNLALTITYEFI